MNTITKTVKNAEAWRLASTLAEARRPVLTTASVIFTPTTAVPTPLYMKNAKEPAKFAKALPAQVRLTALTTHIVKSETAFAIHHIQKLATLQKV